MKTVLLTGGCGFIGRNVATELLRHGYTVRVLDAFIEQVHGDSAPPALEGVEVVRGDVRDKRAVKQALSGADAVIHLAAEVGVGQSMYEISRYVGANDLGTAVLLEAMIERPVQRIVVASSMSVYGEGLYVDDTGRHHDHVRRVQADIRAGRWTPSDLEGRALVPMPTDELKPVDLSSIYALTKYVQERQVMIFGEAYNVPAVALRLFNVFGPGQALSNPYTGVLANFSARLANGQPPLIFEDGQQKRDFVHVRDVATAFRLALEKQGASGQVINIGSGHAYAISEVATMLAAAMGVPDMGPEIMQRARAGDIRNCFADISKARELLGFQPERRLEDSLTELVEWVRSASAVDRSTEMKQHLEQRGLVS